MEGEGGEGEHPMIQVLYTDSHIIGYLTRGVSSSHVTSRYLSSSHSLYNDQSHAEDKKEDAKQRAKMYSLFSGENKNEISQA